MRGFESERLAANEGPQKSDRTKCGMPRWVASSWAGRTGASTRGAILSGTRGCIDHADAGTAEAEGMASKNAGGGSSAAAAPRDPCGVSGEIWEPGRLIRFSRNWRAD
jgi:hypothetical protein